jgi:hypothetical protein
VYGFVLEENVASLHMNREQCILTTMRWLGWTTDKPFTRPKDVSDDGDDDEEEDEDYTIRLIGAHDAYPILRDTFALSNFFPLDMETSILV